MLYHALFVCVLAILYIDLSKLQDIVFVAAHCSLPLPLSFGDNGIDKWTPLDQPLLSHSLTIPPQNFVSQYPFKRLCGADLVFCFAGKKRQQCISGVFFHVFLCLVLIIPHSLSSKYVLKRITKKTKSCGSESIFCRGFGQ